jgi:hypothetical protein
MNGEPASTEHAAAFGSRTAAQAVLLGPGPIGGSGGPKVNLRPGAASKVMKFASGNITPETRSRIVPWDPMVSDVPAS